MLQLLQDNTETRNPNWTLISGRERADEVRKLGRVLPDMGIQKLVMRESTCWGSNQAGVGRQKEETYFLLYLM